MRRMADAYDEAESERVLRLAFPVSSARVRLAAHTTRRAGPRLIRSWRGRALRPRRRSQW